MQTIVYKYVICIIKPMLRWADTCQSNVIYTSKIKEIPPPPPIDALPTNITFNITIMLQ
jgi:hypothetical protein